MTKRQTHQSCVIHCPINPPVLCHQDFNLDNNASTNQPIERSITTQAESSSQRINRWIKQPIQEVLLYELSNEDKMGWGECGAEKQTICTSIKQERTNRERNFQLNTMKTIFPLYFRSKVLPGLIVVTDNRQRYSGNHVEMARTRKMGTTTKTKEKSIRKTKVDLLKWITTCYAYFGR